MARLTNTKFFNKDASGYCISLTDHIAFYEPVYAKDRFGHPTGLMHNNNVYLFGPAIDKLAEYENIRDNPQKIREDLHRGQVAWNENFSLKTEIDKLKEENEKLKKELDARHRIKLLLEQNEKLKKELDGLKTTTLACDLTQLLDENNALKKENEKLKAECADYEKFTKLKNARITKLYYQISKLEKENNENRMLRDAVTRKDEQLEAKDKENDRLQARIDNLLDALAR